MIILAAIFLRFYRLPEFATFLGDQGRDAIIIKRILTFEHFPAIGAPSSLGQIFLGPFYYYLVAPFLLLFNFNPAGLAFGVAVISTIGIIIAFWLINKEFNFLTAFFFLVFSSFSFANIELSRFSWNPNLLPVFSFFTLYFFYKTLTKKSYWYPLSFGALFSFSIQLHYLTVLLFLPMFAMLLINKVFKRKTPASLFINYLLSLVTFVFFSSPLIIFDLRHNFQNTKNFLKLFTNKGLIGSDSFSQRLLETIQSLFLHTFQININIYLTFIFFLILFFVYIKYIWKKNNLFLNINFLNLFFYIFFFSLLNASRFVHYYGPVYLSFFLLLAYLLDLFKKPKFIQLSLIVIILGFFLFENIKKSLFLFGPPSNQIGKAKIIADSIIADKPEVPYQVIALPYVETDDHIRYFLEIEGVRPLEENTLENPKQLYVLCFEKDCSVLGNPQWQIASFKDGKIDKIWVTEGVKIYKLTHNNHA